MVYLVLSLTASYLAFFPEARATNGYFMHGYGMKNKGMGGAGITSTGDAFGGANNPASMVFAATRWDGGVDYFSPSRSAERTGSAGLDASVESESTQFFLPELGFNFNPGERVAVGVTIYGNGGMNTDYPGGQINCGAGAANIMCGTGSLGVDMMQLIVAPYIAHKITDSLSIGISPQIAYQTFEVRGLHAYDSALYSSAPGSVTNNGQDTSMGWGMKVGVHYEKPQFSAGVYYSNRIFMEEFSKYKGLFAQQGDFDIPSHLGLGFGYRFSPKLRLAFDVQKILYGEIKSIANEPTVPVPFGYTEGPGFGWEDVLVYKLGAEFALNDTLALRGGVNYGKKPMSEEDATLSILAPATPELHITGGATYSFGSSEITGHLMYAPEEDLSGDSMLPAGGTDTVAMSQLMIGFSYSRKF